MNKFFTKFVVGAVALAFSVPNANAQTQLFTNGNEGNTPIYWRIPSIVRLTGGDLWAFTDKRYWAATDLGNGYDNPHKIEIYGIKYLDNEAKWGSSAVVLQSNSNASGDQEYLYAFGDAGTVVDRESGKILMMAASGRHGVFSTTTTGRPFVTRSVFDNNKWTTTNVSDQFYGPNNAFTHLFVTSGRIIQSTIYKKGTYYRLYAGVCVVNKSASYVVYSDDFGETWHYLGGSENIPVSDGDECKVEELPNGDILLQTRRHSGATGRYFNVYHFSDLAKGEGNWQASATSGASDIAGQTYASSCNGELMLVPAKRASDNKQTYVLLLSVPASSDRSNICIYWKELPDVYSNPANYVAGWNKYACSSSFCAYTTMAVDKNGNIALLAEGGGIWFQSYSLATITSNKYAYSPSASGTYHTSSEPNFEHGVGGIKKPAMSVAGGTYANSQTITLTAPDGARIYYTLDGSEPQVPTTTTGSGVAPLRAGATTPSGTQLYTAPITLSEGTTTLKALAVDDNGNKSQTVTSTYTIMGTKSKTGTTITLDYKSSNALYTSGGKEYRYFAFLRHNSSHIQLMSSTSADLKEGEQLFVNCENNMEWSKNDTPDTMLILHNGQLENSYGTITRYGHYAIIAPKGYRFLRYEIVMTSGSQDGAKLEEYTYKNGSTSEIELVGTASATASVTGDVTLSRTLDRGTNVLYFRQDALAAGTTRDIKVKSIKLVYAIDQAFDETFPNQNGTAFSSGFVDFGPTSQPDTTRNYGFVNENAHDKEMVNVKNATDQSTPTAVTVDGSKYFMATTEGNYYLEAPTKFRIVGATVNLKRASVNFSSYIPSESTNGVQIVLGASTTDGNSTNTESSGNYLKIDENGTVSNVTSPDQATVFTLDYHTGSGENHYSLKLPNGKYLGMNSSQQIVTLDNVDQALWSYNSGWKFSYTSDKYSFIGSWPSPSGWRAIAMAERSAIAYTKPIAATDFKATVYGPDGNTPVVEGETLNATNSSASVTVDNLNNDAVRIYLYDLTTPGGVALFNVQLKLIALNPEVESVQATALANGTGDAMGNSPVTSENYIFNHGNVINVPVTAGSKTATMVFRNAHNEELTNWYTNGETNTNGASETGSYSNLYLIGSKADKDWSSTKPSPGARTDVDSIGTIQIPATNIDTLAAEKDKAGTKRSLTLQDNTVNVSSAKYQKVTMTVGSKNEPTTYYLYSADKPTYKIMPDGLPSVGDHIDFRFYSIKVKPVEAEKPLITIVPLYTSTMKGRQNKTNIASDGTELNIKDKYVGIKVESQLNDGVTGSVAGYLTAEAIEDSIISVLNKSAYRSPHDGDPLRNVLYVDMSSLTTVTTANSTTMASYASATADNCLFFMPTGFAATNMANTIAKQSDGTTYQAIGDVTVYDQQPFFTPHSFTTGQFKASYTRESTNSKALVRNMASVLPFDITLDAGGHPYLNGETNPRSNITFYNITGYGELTGVKKNETNHELTYAMVAKEVSTLKAEANKPYYVSKKESEPAGFEFSIPNATFEQTPYDKSDNTDDPDKLQITNGTWTAHGTYNGVAPKTSDYLWYFSKELFWKSGQLETFGVVNVRPFRAYYITTDKTPAVAKAGVVYDESDVIPTGIHDIQAAPAHNGRVYTIDGRYVGTSLDNLAPGLYIQNGRKVVKQ